MNSGGYAGVFGSDAVLRCCGRSEKRQFDGGLSWSAVFAGEQVIQLFPHVGQIDAGQDVIEV